MNRLQKTQKPGQKKQIEAIQILINAVEMGQRKGAYNLDEAVVIAQAKRAFIADRSGNGTGRL